MNAVSRTRILFVDDEPGVRELFPVMVSTVDGQWETRCVDSGRRALEALERETFDLVVSDMRMPGMTGAELLNEVLRRYPATGRMIVTGFAEESDVLRCVGSTHQFLSKPFDLPVLRAALNRFRSLREGLRSEEIQRLVTRKQSLPSLPSIFIRLLQVLQDPDCSTEEIGNIIASDAGLTAKVLQLVNSPFFGFSREVSSAGEAVSLLGTGAIRSLVLATELFSKFQKDQKGACWPHHHGLWWHSMRVGQWARRIVEIEQGGSNLAEEAFTAGVLHDVGQLILMDQMPQEYLDLLARASRQNRVKTEVEREVLGATHAEVGAYLLDLWGLPAPLVEAVALHHEPGRSCEPTWGSLTAVHVANVLEEAQQSEDPGAVVRLLDGLYLDQLGLGSRVHCWAEELGIKIDV